MSCSRRLLSIFVLFPSIVFGSILANGQTAPATSEWAMLSSAESGLSEARLHALEDAIRGGEFKKIGSVLIARHGKLAYESYFDGDAATLRDTRSATKSITDALIGIAIDEQNSAALTPRY